MSWGRHRLQRRNGRSDGNGTISPPHASSRNEPKFRVRVYIRSTVAGMLTTCTGIEGHFLDLLLYNVWDSPFFCTRTPSDLRDKPQPQVGVATPPPEGTFLCEQRVQHSHCSRRYAPIWSTRALALSGDSFGRPTHSTNVCTYVVFQTLLSGIKRLYRRCHRDQQTTQVQQAYIYALNEADTALGGRTRIHESTNQGDYRCTNNGSITYFEVYIYMYYCVRQVSYRVI